MSKPTMKIHTSYVHRLFYLVFLCCLNTQLPRCEAKLKVWERMNLFQSCTHQFILPFTTHSADYWMDGLGLMQEKCIYYQNCISIVGRFPSQYTEQGPKRAITNKTCLRGLAPKHSKACMVSLASVTVHKNKLIQIEGSVKLWSVASQDQEKHIYSPAQDYILMVVNIKPGQAVQMDVPVNFPPKVLLFTHYETLIQIGLLNIHNPIEIYKNLNSEDIGVHEFVYLTEWPLSISKIDSIWNKVITSKWTRRSSSKMFSQTILDLKVNTRKLLSQPVCDHFNFTFRHANTHHHEHAHIKNAAMGKVMYNSFGTSLRSGSLKYYWIVRKQNLEHAEFQKISAMFSPLSVQVWLLMSLLFITLAPVLSARKHKSCLQTIYWLYSTLVEQDGYIGLKQMTKIQQYLVAMWLFCGVLFRNLYTFSMYAEMTKLPYPNWLPQNFNSLLQGQHNRKIFVPCCSLQAVTSHVMTDTLLNQYWTIPEKLDVWGRMLLKVIYGAPPCRQIVNRSFKSDFPYSQQDANGRLVNDTLKKTEDFVVAIYSSVCSDESFLAELSFKESIIIYETNEELPYYLTKHSFWFENVYFTEIYVYALAMFEATGIRSYVEWALSTYFLKKSMSFVGQEKLNAFKLSSNFVGINMRQKPGTGGKEPTAFTPYRALDFERDSLKSGTIDELSAVWLVFIIFQLSSFLAFFAEMAKTHISI